MIVSVSRRCDIPAWGMDAFMADLAAGFRLVPNPFDARKARRVSLLPEDVDCLVFWTRNPRAILEREAELRERGYPFIVQVTITGYPRALEPGVPDVEEVAATMRELASRIGKRRIAWRYDPVVATAPVDDPDEASSGAAAYAAVPGRPRLDAAFHAANFAAIADGLEGAVGRVIVSLLDEYSNTRVRLARAGYPDAVFASPRGTGAGGAGGAGGHGEAGATGAPGTAKGRVGHETTGQACLPGLGTEREAAEPRLPPQPYLSILEALARAARERGLGLQACAEDFDLEGFGISRGACVDGDLVREVCGKDLEPGRDTGQRQACLCAKSVDVGAYGPCPAACSYCYARR